MMRIAGRVLSFVVMLLAAVVAYERAQAPEYIGIDFVQFHLTGRYVAAGGDPRVYSGEVRARILESAWQSLRTGTQDSKLYHAVNFRHERSWETYSSPFLYAVFGLGAGEGIGAHRPEGRDSQQTPSAALSGTFSPAAGEKEERVPYENALRVYWIICLGSTMAGFVMFGWVLRIPGWSMLLGAVVLVWFSPLRVDMNVANVNQIQFGMLGVLAAILGFTVDRPLRRPGTITDTAEAEEKSCRRRGRTTVRHFLAGVWLGLCLAFKPSLLWCGVMWLGPMMVALWSEQRRHAVRQENSWPLMNAAVLGGMLGGIIAVAFSSIWFPLHSWIDWVKAVRSLPDDIIQTHQGNFSPTYYAGSCGVPQWLMMLTGPVIAATVLFGLKMQPGSGRGTTPLRNNPTIEKKMAMESRPVDIARWLAIGCLIHMLTSRLVWYHYFLLSLPGILVMIGDAIAATNRLEKVAIGTIACWCLLLLGLEPVDVLLQSLPDEHMLRCTIANAILLMAMTGGGRIQRSGKFGKAT